MLGSMPSVNDPAWYDVIGRFRAKAREFQDAFNTLLNARQAVATMPALAQQADALIRRGEGIRDSVQSITRAIDGVSNWWSNLFGESRPDIDMPGALGAVPLIPIAVVAASVTAMTYFITDVYKFVQRVNEAQRLQASGVAPDEAARLSQGYGGSTAFGNARAMLMTGAVIAGIVVVLPLFLQRGK